MALNRFGTNLIFGCVVALLALIAAASIYENYQPHKDKASETAEKRLAEFELLAGKNPQNPYYPTQIGNTYYDIGQYGKAAVYYERSLAIHPQDPNVETDLANCYHYLGQHDKALETLDKVLKYNPGFSQAIFNKGRVLIDGKKNTKEGIAAWEELLRADPNSPHKAEIEQEINQLKAFVK